MMVRALPLIHQVNKLYFGINVQTSNLAFTICYQSTDSDPINHIKLGTSH